ARDVFRLHTAALIQETCESPTHTTGNWSSLAQSTAQCVTRLGVPGSSLVLLIVVISALIWLVRGCLGGRGGPTIGARDGQTRGVRSRCGGSRSRGRRRNYRCGSGSSGIFADSLAHLVPFP